MKSYRVRERMHEDLLNDLLLARGIQPDEHEQFLNPDFERDSHDPFLLPDMGEATLRIIAAKKNGEKVAVWSDYDCDGIPGGVMLTQFLRTFGLDTTHYIPHRHKEGYGLNTEGIDELASAGVKVIITVDLGTTDFEQIAHANKKGIDVIVTDHHIVPSLEHVPAAFALINPKRPDSRYPFDGLCGAGVAWKLVQALLIKDRSVLGEGQEKWLLDLVGIATLSDMVPLVGENRMLAHSGLRVMRRGRRPGIATLLKLLRINTSSLTEDDVTFMLSPRINAASRMDRPQIAAELLAATGEAEAAERAATLNRINDERKGVVAATVKEVNKRVAESDLTKSPLIVMGNPNWRPGILGLVASSLVEAHGKTVFLWGREGGEELRGSCRSNGQVNIVELMGAAREVFGDFGGHSASGGFSVLEEKVHELSGRLTVAYESVKTRGLAEEAAVLDRELDLAEVPHAQKNLERLAPFGTGFQKPLFIFPNLSIGNVRIFGKQQNHLELALARSDVKINGVTFFSTPESFTKKIAAGEKGDIIGHIERDWQSRPRLRVVDIL